MGSLHALGDLLLSPIAPTLFPSPLLLPSIWGRGFVSSRQFSPARQHSHLALPTAYLTVE